MNLGPGYEDSWLDQIGSNLPIWLNIVVATMAHLLSWGVHKREMKAHLFKLFLPETFTQRHTASDPRDSTQLP